MALAFSRNPLFLVLRSLVGLGLLVVGLLGLAGSAHPGGTGAAAYLKLPQCPANPIPTNGSCYSIVPGSVVDTRRQLTTLFVTLTDSQGSHEVELADGDRAATFQPGTAVAVKYWKDKVTAVGVPAPGDTAALTSTVDSPLVPASALRRKALFAAAGLVGLLLGIVPVLLRLSGRTARRAATLPPVPYLPHATIPGSPPGRAIYSPPSVLPSPAPPMAPVASGGAPPPARAAGFLLPTSGAPAGFALAASRQAVPGPGPAHVGQPGGAPAAADAMSGFAVLSAAPPEARSADLAAMANFTVLGAEPPAALRSAPPQSSGPDGAPAAQPTNGTALSQPSSTPPNAHPATGPPAAATGRSATEVPPLRPMPPVAPPPPVTPPVPQGGPGWGIRQGPGPGPRQAG
ncbi:MAG: hypothetical protein ABR541_01605 [Candidatus Dormibacteria bacterium]